MKLLSVAILLLGVFLQQSLGAPNPNANAESTRERYKGYRETCGQELGTSPAVMQLAEAGRWTGKDADNTEMHCLVRCIGLKAQYYSDETGMVWDKVVQMMPQNAAGGADADYETKKQAMNECIGALTAEDYGTDNCKKAYLYYGCAMKTFRKQA